MRPKKQKLFLAILALLTTSFTSCKGSDLDQGLLDDSTSTQGCVNFEAEMNTITKATDTAFESGDVISVTAYDQSGELYQSSVSYSYDGALFSSESPIKLTEDVTTLSYRALYPYVEMSEDKIVRFSIKSDQSIDNNYTLSDFMSSYTAATSLETPTLYFQHLLSKIVVNIASSDIELVDVKVAFDSPMDVVYNLSTLISVSDEDTYSTITLCDDGVNSYKAIVAPQTISVGKVGTITVGGRSFDINNTDAVALKAGKEYSYNLYIENSTVTFVLGAIDGWDSDVEDDVIYDVSDYKFVAAASDGVVHGSGNLDKMKAIIAKADPSSVGYKAYVDLTNYSYGKSSWSGYVGNIPTYISRDAGTAGDLDEGNNPYPVSFSKNSSTVTNHFDAAYMSALQYALGVEDAEAHAAKALAILKGYAESVTVVYDTGNAPLMCGQGYHAASALALLKGYEGLTDEIYDMIVDDLLVGCFIPVLDRFFQTGSKGGGVPYTNGNWGLCATLTYMTIAVVAEDAEMYKFAINQYRTGEGCSNHNSALWEGSSFDEGQIYNYMNDNGSIFNYLDPVTGQCQETGRDQAHVQFGLSCAALICEVAYNQGHPELYRENSDALLTGLEYTAELLLLGYANKDNLRYFNWWDVTGKYRKWTSIGTDEDDFSYGKCWTVVYNHFVNRLGMEMPYTKQLFESEGWPSSYTSEGYWYDMFTFAPHPDDQL